MQLPVLERDVPDVGLVGRERHLLLAEDQVSAKGIELFRELIEFGLVTVTVGV